MSIDSQWQLYIYIYFSYRVLAVDRDIASSASKKEWVPTCVGYNDITLLNHRLARIYTESKQFGEVLTLLKNNGDFFATIPKAKTAKTVRNILNIVASVPDSLDIQINLCKDVIDWCKIEKRTFLRQRIEAKVKFVSEERGYSHCDSDCSLFQIAKFWIWAL